MEPGLFVPWMAYSPTLSVSAAAPMGLFPLPPRITLGREGLSRLTSAGGGPAGRRYLSLIIAGATDANGIAQRSTVAEHIVERALTSSHHHRAWRVGSGESDDFASLRRLRKRSRCCKHEHSRAGCQPSRERHV